MNQAVNTADNGIGQKHDANKPRYHLMPRLAEREVVKVLTFGALKYDEQNWRNVKPLDDRYYSAARRHVDDYFAGDKVDDESYCHPLAHAICCLLFMLENDLQQQKDAEPLPASLQRQAD